ncbi:MAG: leucine-rich repeat protein [Dysgonamonadaceae bacterium]|jgi:hypothetical protein|nr:leucine-rich repeat protein [Dysgonamonadaceae bacterium]
MMKTFFTAFFCLTLALNLAAQTSGATGDCTWTLTGASDNLVLTISGNGEMANYPSSNSPWRSQRANIKTVVITDGVTSIGSLAFYYCSGLTSVTIGNSVTSIGNYAFYGCSGLTSVTIPNLVDSISDGAFYGCSGLTSVTIPNSVTSIGNSAFYGCSGLTSVTIPNSVASIGDEAFYYCSGLTSVTIGNSVISIGSGAFFGCSGLTSVTIGNSVTSIGNYAFYYCSGLTSVTIGNSVISIGSGVFYGCSGLTSINVNDNNPNYSSLDGVLFNKDKTTFLFYPEGKTGAYNIPNSVASIDEAAFFSCGGLTSVTIPNSVISIGSGAFYGCSSLTSINVNDNNPNYSSLDGVLFNKDKTTLLCYPGGKTGAYNIPTSVTSINEAAFFSCRGLTDVAIPNSVTAIGDYAFSTCSGLTSVTIPNSVDSISDGAFYSCSGLTSVTIPNSVTAIGNYAFRYCLSLTSVTIPNSVASIGEGAFASCSGLTSVTIPNSVTAIGNYAFLSCSGLTDVTVNWVAPLSIDSKVFQYLTLSNITLHIPCDTYNLYATAPVWQDFNITASAATGITLNQSTASLSAGSTLQLTATALPSTACNPNVSWQSTDNSVATVADGLVTAVNKGVCTIIATTEEGNFMASCNVAVTGVNGINDVETGKLQLYPNPVREELFIKSDLPIKKVEICTLSGALLIQENNFNEKLSVSAFLKGIYLIKVYTEKGVVIQKIVKE